MRGSAVFSPIPVSVSVLLLVLVTLLAPWNGGENISCAVDAFTFSIKSTSTRRGSVSCTDDDSTTTRLFSVAPPSPSTTSTCSSSTEQHWMDFMKFDGTTPEFDTLALTKEFNNCANYEEAEKYYDRDYVFRGPVVGPITSKDVKETQKRFNVMAAYPDLVMQKFGYTIDPDNPYRCYWFERWTGTNQESIQMGPLALPPTNKVAVIPTHIMSINWTPNGKIIYMCLSAPLDRFEGNTMGQGAVFGLLKTGGVPLPAPSVGNLALSLNQKYVAPLIQQKAFSDDADVPNWWKSKSKGADANDI